MIIIGIGIDTLSLSTFTTLPKEKLIEKKFNKKETAIFCQCITKTDEFVFKYIFNRERVFKPVMQVTSSYGKVLTNSNKNCCRSSADKRRFINKLTKAISSFNTDYNKLDLCQFRINRIDVFKDINFASQQELDDCLNQIKSVAFKNKRTYDTSDYFIFSQNYFKIRFYDKNKEMKSRNEEVSNPNLFTLRIEVEAHRQFLDYYFNRDIEYLFHNDTNNIISNIFYKAFYCLFKKIDKNGVSIIKKAIYHKMTKPKVQLLFNTFKYRNQKLTDFFLLMIFIKKINYPLLQ